MTGLRIRYERLLFAYPREYRRHRGAEITTTFLEMAADGQRWPRAREVASLLVHGLRARLGRPRSRLVVPLTVLAMLIGGLCAAAAGARLGWGGSTGLSGRQLAEANRLEPRPLLGTDPTGINVPPGAPDWSADYLSTPAWQAGVSYVISFHAAPGSGDFVTFHLPDWYGGDMNELVAKERAQLAGTGWTVTGVTIDRDGPTMMARNGDLAARLEPFSAPPGSAVFVSDATEARPVTADDGIIQVGDAGTGLSGLAPTVYRTTPAAVPVVMVVAGLLGALVTYLLIGGLSRRSDRLAAAYRRMVLTGLGLAAALAAPVAVVCGVGIWAALRDHGDVPVRYWGGFVTGDARIAAVTAAIVLAVTVAGAAVGRPARPAPEVAR